MKHATPRRPRALRTAALILTLAGTTSAQAVGFKVHAGGAAPSSYGYGAHLGAYTAPWKVAPAPHGSQYHGPEYRGPWGGYGKPTKYHAPTPARIWVPGSWKIERQRIWIAGAPQTVWEEAVYATKFNSYGATVNVLVTPGHYTTIAGPGHWAVQPKKAWAPGHWVLGH